MARSNAKKRDEKERTKKRRTGKRVKPFTPTQTLRLVLGKKKRRENRRKNKRNRERVPSPCT